MNILALDPATKTGWAHTNGQSGVVRLAEADDEPIGRRLMRLFQFVRDFHSRAPFDVLAIEHAAVGARSFDQTQFHAKLRGIAELVATDVGAVVWAYWPQAVKIHATGSGNAKKEQMIAAAKMQLGVTPQDDNHADALWILELAKRGPPAPTKKKQRAAKRKAAASQPNLFSKFRVKRSGA